MSKMMASISMFFWMLRRPSIWSHCWKIPPWHKYKIIPTGQECIILSYFENGTVRVLITDGGGPFNGEDYEVFGYEPRDLRRLAA